MKIFLLLFVITLNSYAQQTANKFLLAPDDYYANEFSVDRIAQIVYFDFSFGTPYKIDLKTMAVTPSNFLNAPIFSNKQHLMIYGNSLYDIDKGSQYEFTFPDSTGNTYTGLPRYFSPNDRYLMCSNSCPESNPYRGPFRSYIFSLEDSSLTPVDTSVHIDYSGYRGVVPQWSSDTSIVFPTSQSSIAEYFIHSKRIDTLVTPHISDYNQIVSFAYNTRLNILAYSIYIGGEVPRIYFHYRDSAEDVLAFSPLLDDSLCGANSLALVYTYLCWSPDNDRLGFLGYGAINEMTDIYFYSTKSNRTFRVSQCNDMDLKYFLQWANEDTLIYVDNNDFHLYGIDISNVIDGIAKNKDEPTDKDFSISSYPNPFNNSIRFTVSLPERTSGILSIYDILGRLLKEYEIKNDGRTNYKIDWNCLNSSNIQMSSGFYSAILTLADSKTQSRKITKIIYLK